MSASIIYENLVCEFICSYLDDYYNGFILRAELYYKDVLVDHLGDYFSTDKDYLVKEIQNTYNCNLRENRRRKLEKLKDLILNKVPLLKRPTLLAGITPEPF